jgi:integrase
MSALESNTSVLRTLPPPRARQTNRRGRRLASSSASAYDKDLVLFHKLGGTVPCEPAAVLRFIELLRKRVSAITAYRRVMAVQRAHVDGGFTSPTDDPTLRTAIRWLQTGRYPPKPGSKAAAADVPAKRVARSAKPLTRLLLERCLDALGRDMLDRRDRMLLTLGFLAALKRQQLVALDVRDLAFTPDAMIVTLRHADGSVRRTVAVAATVGGALCAVAACRQYIEHLALPPEAPLLAAYNRAGEPTSNRLCAAFVSVVVKRALTTVGIDARHFSGESLRRGRVLEAAKGTL